MGDGVLGKVCSRVQPQLFRDARFVKFHGLHRDAENRGDFFERAALGHQLQNFTLAQCQRCMSTYRGSLLMQQGIQHPFRQ